MGEMIIAGAIALVFYFLGYKTGQQITVHEEELETAQAPVIISELDEFAIEQQRKGVKGEW